MSIYRTNKPYITDIETTTSDINIITRDGYDVNINSSLFSGNGDVKLNNIHLLDENDDITYKKLYNDDTELYWGNKSVLTSDDDIFVNDISFSGNLNIGAITYRFPENYGSDADVLKTNADGSLYWGTVTGELSGLSDVNITNPQNDELFKFSSGSWVNTSEISNLSISSSTIEDSAIGQVTPASGNFTGLHSSSLQVDGDLSVDDNINLSGHIKDQDANELIKFTSVSDAVNEITISNNDTTNNPIISATGNDTNVGIDFQVKGNESYNFKSTSTVASKIKLYENANNGNHSVTIAAPNIITSDITLTLPVDTGIDGQVLKTDGSGILSWADSLTINNEGDNRLITSNGAGGVDAESNLTFDGTDMKLIKASNNGNPQVVIGASDLESVSIQALYDTNSQTLDKVKFVSRTESTDVGKGAFEFNVNENNVVTIGTSGINIQSNKKLKIGGTDILDNDTGVTTLKNINDIDDTTMSAIETNIDSLSNLTSASSLSTVGTVTTGTWQADVVDVSYGGTGVTSLGTNQVLIGNGTDAVTTSSNLTYDTVTLKVTGNVGISGSILDPNNNELISKTYVTNAVNNLGVSNAIVGTNPSLNAVGDDINIGIDFTSKGTGTYNFKSTSDAATVIKLYEKTTDGGNTLSLKTPALTSDIEITLPNTTGTSGQVLTTDGTGVTSWTSKLSLTNDGDNRLVTATGSGNVTGEANLTFDGTNLSLYNATNNSNPAISVGSSINEGVVIQPIYDAGSNTLDKVSINTKTISGTVNKGKYEVSVDDLLILTIDDGGCEVKQSGNFRIGSSVILSDASGTTTLSNIDALDATTETTIENAIDTLPNLTSASSLATIGTVTSGTWNGTAIGVAYGGTGQTSLANNSVLTGNGTSGVVAETNLTFDGSTLSVNGDVQLSGSVKDHLFGNELLKFSSTGANAVNEITIGNNVTTNNPTISATGNDSNIGIDFQAKGNGKYNFKSTSSQATELVLFEDTDNGSNTISIKAPPAIATNFSLTLPNADGTASQVIKTDGSGNLGWADLGGVTINNDGANRIITTNGASSLFGAANLLFNGTSLTQYVPTNNGNPTFDIGSSTNEQLTIQSVYDTGAQTLDKVTFTSKANSLTADKGKFEFYVDEALVSTFNDAGLMLKASGTLAIGSSSILTDSAGTTTLSNIDALDATTESTIEAAIDTLSNLTSASSLSTIGTVTTGTWQGSAVGVPYGGTGQATFTAGGIILGNTTSALSASSNLTYNSSILNMAASSKLAIGGINIIDDTSGTTTLSNIDALDATTESTIEAAIDTLSNLTSASSLSTIGTITTGTWQGSAVGVPYGGTGQATFTAGGILLGNTTSALSASSNLTYNSSILNMAASSKLAIGGINIIDDTSGTTTLSNIDALDATTESTIEAAIDTLSNLTSASSLSTIGTITTGTWQGSTVGVAYGGTGVTNLATDGVLTGNGTSGVVSETNLTFDGSTLGLTGNLQISGNVIDTNSNELLSFITTGSAVNEFTMTNAITATNPVLSATGNDSNIGIDFQVKGTGKYNFKSTSSQATELVLFEDVDNGSNTISIRAPATLATSFTLTLPDSDGSLDQVLTTDGNGVLSWTDGGSNITIDNDGNNRIITATGAGGLNGEAYLTFDGTNLNQYVATNDANPVFAIGSGSTETLQIQSIYDTGAQTLDKVTFTTKANSLTADKGKFEFYVDEALVSTFNDSGLMLKASGTLAIGSSSILTDSAGTTTLSNIDAIDSTTNTTISNAITSLSNLATVGTITTGTWNATNIGVPYGGTGANTFTAGGIILGNTTSALSASSNLTYNSSILNMAVSSKLAIGGINIIDDTSGTTTLSNIDALDATTESTIEAAINTLTNLTSASSLSTIGTVTTGTWNATAVSVPYGGTGQATFTAGGILLGNTTSALSASSSLTYNSSILNMAASSKLAIGGINIIDDTAGTTTLSNIDALDATTESTIENAIDTLTNLTSASSLSTVGTITTGTWQGSTVVVAYGGTGVNTLATDGVLTGNGTSGVVSETNLTFNGSTLGVTGDIRLSGSVLDTNNNELIKFTTVTSAVNEITFSNNSSGSTPIISATGGDSNVGIQIRSKGVGAIQNYVNSTNIQEIGSSYVQNYNETRISNGSNYIAYNAGTPTANYTLIQPSLPPVRNQIQTFSSTPQGSAITMQWEDKYVASKGSLVANYIVDYANCVTDFLTDTGYTFPLNGFMLSGSPQNILRFQVSATTNGKILRRYFGLNTEDMTAIGNLLNNKYVLFGLLYQLVYDFQEPTKFKAVGLYKCLGISGGYLEFYRPDSSGNADTYGAAMFKPGISVNPNGTVVYCRNNGLYYTATNNTTIIVGSTDGDIYGFAITATSNDDISVTTNTGALNIFNKSSAAAGIKLHEAHANGIDSVSLTAPSLVTSSYNAILPQAGGNVGQTMIVTNVAGSDVTLGFGTPTYGYTTISSNTTAVVNTVYLCNTSSAIFTVTLPSAPPVGSVVCMIDSTSSFSTNNLLIARGGSDVMFVNTATTSVTSLSIGQNNTKITCEYVAVGRWNVTYIDTSGVKIALLKEEFARNTKPSFTAATGWLSRGFTTEYDPDGIVSLSVRSGGTLIPGVGGNGNQFTLGPGKYLVEIRCPSTRSDRHKIELRTSAGTLVAMGTSSFTDAGAFYASTDGMLSTLITISSSTTYRVNHFFASAAGATFLEGVETNAVDSTGTPAIETYGEVKIIKYDDPVTTGIVSVMNTYNRETISTTTNPLAVNTLYSCNTSGGAFTVTLPSIATAVGDYIELMDSTGSFATFNLTINTGGSHQMFANSSTNGVSTLVIGITNSKIKCTYVASNRWCLEYLNVTGIKFAVLRDEKVRNTSGGTSTSATWHQRVINVKYDPSGIVTIPSLATGALTGANSLSSDQVGATGDRTATTNTFTLGPGNYYIDAMAPSGGSNSHKIALMTGSTVLCMGTTEFSSAAAAPNTHSFIKYPLTVSASTTYYIRHYTQTGVGTFGLGTANNTTDPNSIDAPEVHTTIAITKYDDPIQSGVISVLNTYNRATISTTTNPLVVNTLYSCNTSGGAFTVTLPSVGVAPGDYIELMDSAGSFGTNNLTINTGGAHQMFANSNTTGASTLVIGITNTKVKCTFVATNRWCLEYLSSTGYKIALLKDEKARNTSGGTPSGAAWNQRVINTEYDPDNIVSLSGGTTGTGGTANAFTLQPGKYAIEINAFAGGVNSHKAILVDSNDVLIATGTAEYNFNGGGQYFANTTSFIWHVMSISTATTYKIQHYTLTSNSFGGQTNVSAPTVVVSLNEVYSLVKITKYDDNIQTGIVSVMNTYNRATINSTTNPLVVNTIYACNTSAGAFTVTLPSIAPAVGDYIELFDSTGSFATFNLTINTGGSHQMFVNTNTTGASTLVVGITNSKVKCTYVASNRWCLEYQNNVGVKYAIIREEQARNVNGGTSVATTWTTRTINTEYDPDSIVTLSANQFTLLPGKYFIECRTPHLRADSYKTALYTSGGALVCMGTGENSATADNTQTNSYISTLLNISSATTYVLRYHSQSANATFGLGVGQNITDANGTSAIEVYTIINIAKYDDPITSGVISVLNAYNRATISTNTNPLVVNTLYSCNTSGGAFNVTLPASPTQGDYIELIDSTGSFSTNNLTIVAAGPFIFANTSTTGVSSLVIGITNSKVGCTFVASNRWCVEYQNANGIKIAILADERAANGQSGAPTATSWNTRVINVKYDPDSIVTIVGEGVVSYPNGGVGNRAVTSTNQFTLQPGKYLIDAACSQYGAQQNKLCLVTSGGTVVAIGMSSWDITSGNGGGANPELSTLINISSATTYSLRHYITTSASADGFGVRTGSINDPTTVTLAPEVFVTIKITKYDQPATAGISSQLAYYNRATISTTTNPLVVNTIYSCNTSGGAFTVTLPSIDPAQGDYIELVDSTGSFATNNLTIAAAGNHMFVNSNNTGTALLAIGITNCNIKCTYVASNRWCIEYINATGIKCATLRDLKSGGVQGGGATAGSWFTRTLNDENDPDGIVSLASNQFTLAPGKYMLNALLVNYTTNTAQAAIFNVTTNTYTYGLSARAAATDTTSVTSSVNQQITLSTTNVFELRNRVETTSGTSGNGAATGFSANEVYASVQITKYDDPITSGVNALMSYYNRATISTTTNPLVVNTIYSCNTSGGAFTVTLPSAAPAQGDYIELIDSTGSFAINNLTITSTGGALMYVNSNTTGSTSLVIGITNCNIKCTFVNTNRWCIEYQNATGVKCAVLWDEQNGTTDGASITAGPTWTQRRINTKSDPDNIVTLSGGTTGTGGTANAFTLNPGKYLIRASVPSSQVAFYKTLLMSGSTVIATGTSEYSGAANTVVPSTRSFIETVVNISTATSYYINHTVQTTPGWSGGRAYNVNDPNATATVNVYTLISITKYDDPITSGVNALMAYYNRATISTTTNPLVVNTIYSCNTSGGAFTVTLPSVAPAQGDYIQLIDAMGSFATNNLTIVTGGANQMYVNSNPTGSTSLVIGITNCNIRCTYVASNRWCIEYINATGIKYAILRDEKVKNTNGGTNASTPFWNTRTINTEYDPHNIVSLTNGSTGVGGTANQFILGPGNYLINVSSPVEQVRYYRVELFNVTTNSPVACGINNFTSAADDVSGVGMLDYILQVSTTTTYSIKLYASAVAANWGLGAALNVNNSNNTDTSANFEVYTTVQITKYDDPISSGVVSVLNTYNRLTISTTTNPLLVNTIYSCDTSGGAFTVTLPSSAIAQGDYIELIDSTGSFATNNLTLAAAGAFMFVNSNTTGTSSLVIGITNVKIRCTFVNTNRWTIEYMNATGVKWAKLKDTKATGTDGGTFTSGAWQTRTLQTEVDPSSIVSISSNQFTLLPGSYSIQIKAPAYAVNSHQCALFNVTTSSYTAYGSNERTSSTDTTGSSSFLYHVFLLSATTTFEVRHRCETTTNTTGFGTSLAALAESNFTDVIICKYDDPISSGVMSVLNTYNRVTISTTTNPLLVNTIYSCNTTSGAFTVTLPSIALAQGDYIQLIDSNGTFATNNLTIATTGGALMYVNSNTTGSSSLVIGITNSNIRCTFVNTNRWCIEYQNATGVKFALLRDEQTRNTTGGTSTGSSWLVRTINTEYDPDGIVSIASNQFTLLPGKYYLKCKSPFLQSGRTRIAIYTSAGALVAMGDSFYAQPSSDNTVIFAECETLINISTSTTYVLRYFVTNGLASQGLGVESNMADANSAAASEIYTSIAITKYDDPISSGVVSVLNTYNRVTISTTTNPLQVNTIYSVNTSGGAFTVTLPTLAIAQGDYIELIDSMGTFSTNNLTIAAAGAYMYVNSNTTASSTLVIGIANSIVRCTYVASNRWCIEYLNATGVKMAILVEQKAFNVQGGSASTSGTRVLNIESDPDGIVTLSGGTTGVGGTANTFTLNPGKYNIVGSMPFWACNAVQAILYDAANNIIALGSSDYCNTGASVRSVIDAVINVGTATSYQLRYIAQAATATNGLGVATSISASIDSIYSILKITKYDDPISSGVVSVLNTYNRLSISATTNPLLVNTIYACNTTAGAFTVTLPTSAVSQGDYIELMDSTGSFGTNNLTINTGGSHQMFVNTSLIGSSSLLVTGSNAVIKCKYANTNRWCIEYPNALGMKVAVLRDEKARNNAGGASVATSWNTRTINVEYDPDGIVSIVSGGAITYPNGGIGNRAGSTNQFTLNPGKYLIKATSPSFASAHNKIALVTSTGTVITIGTNEWNNNAATNAQTSSSFEIPVTISTATTYLIRHYITAARAGDGLGVNINVADPASADAYEVFTTITIIKYDDPISTGIVSVLPNSYINKLPITSTTTLASNTYYYITGLGTYTLTLPSTPSLGDIIEITDGTGALSTNVATITRSGVQNILIGDVSVTSFDMNRNGMKCKLEFVNTNRWVMTTSSNEGIWQTYTLVWGAVTTAPTMPTTILRNTARYTVVGKMLFIHYDYYHASATGSAGGSGTYLFPLPPGYTIPSYINNADSLTSTANRFSVGSGYTQTSSNTNSYTTQMIVFNSTNLAMVGLQSSNTSNYVGTVLNPITQAPYSLSFNVCIPLD